MERPRLPSSLSALPVAGLRGSGGPGLEIVALENGRRTRWRCENFRASASSETRQPVSPSRYAALQSADLMSVCSGSGSFAGSPKRRWIAASSRVSTVL